MHWRHVFKVVGVLTITLAFTMVIPLLVGLFYHDMSVHPFLLAIGATLAGGLARVGGLCLLAPVRPHPHVGFTGAVTGLGPGLADFQGKLMLHRDIRPKVDTPLCAGCGSCLSVCLFDAITIEAGRANISHEKCTGCGECMNVCFMAGISAEDAASIPLFQRKLAAACLLYTSPSPRDIRQDLV